MRFTNFISTLLYMLFGCAEAIQLPQRHIAYPTEDNLYLGSTYKNQQISLSDLGFPLKSVPYFNYEDFRDFSPAGRILAEKPYETEKDLNKIPAEKFGFYHELTVDSATVNYLSNLLLNANRPVLNNFYTGQETYRFVWTRAFHDDYIFELYKQENQAIIHTTRIDKQSGVLETADKVVSLNEFEEFKTLLTNGNFWAIKPYEWVLQVDGSRWTIEAHVPLGYKVLSRSSPGLIQEDELLLRQAGQWLISKGTHEVKDVY